MGGTVGVESAPGRGTTFEFTLPADDGEAASTRRVCNVEDCHKASLAYVRACGVGTSHWTNEIVTFAYSCRRSYSPSATRGGASPQPVTGRPMASLLWQHRPRPTGARLRLPHSAAPARTAAGRQRPHRSCCRRAARRRRRLPPPEPAEPQPAEPPQPPAATGDRAALPVPTVAAPKSRGRQRSSASAPRAVSTRRRLLQAWFTSSATDETTTTFRMRRAEFSAKGDDRAEAGEPTRSMIDAARRRSSPGRPPTSRIQNAPPTDGRAGDSHGPQQPISAALDVPGLFTSPFLSRVRRRLDRPVQDPGQLGGLQLVREAALRRARAVSRKYGDAATSVCA